MPGSGSSPSIHQFSDGGRLARVRFQARELCKSCSPLTGVRVFREQGKPKIGPTIIVTEIIGIGCGIVSIHPSQRKTCLFYAVIIDALDTDFYLPTRRERKVTVASITGNQAWASAYKVYSEFISGVIINAAVKFDCIRCIPCRQGECLPCRHSLGHNDTGIRCGCR